ncbi:MAG TPA: PIN domain-containing protein [Thermoanaerobaculia bacterium]
MRFMLETSVCVELLRGRIASRRLPEASDCVLSVITLAELEVGIRRSARPAVQRKAVDAFTDLFEVAPWDVESAGHYGDLRVDLERRGAVIGPLDLLIAAHARRLGATLITANARKFQRVAGLACLEWSSDDR